MEEQVRRLRLEGDVADLVDDQQRVATELGELVLQPPRVMRRREAGDPPGRGGEQGAAFGALNTSPGARAYYDQRRAQGQNHNQALRALSNRLVGVLHGCLHHGATYDEATAWPRHRQQDHADA